MSGVERVLLRDLGHVHVPDFDAPVLEHEDVRRLQVSVDDPMHVQHPQASQHLKSFALYLNQDFPDVLFVDLLPPLPKLVDPLEQVPIVCILRYYARKVTN